MPSSSSRELVRRAIEFRHPSRIPFWQHTVAEAPDDVADVWEMDRARAGWFFDAAGRDDWGCVWERSHLKNMGQVVVHPLSEAEAAASFRPPDPRDPFYFERIEPLLARAGDRYIVVSSHFNLIERLHMLRGFGPAMEGFHLEPEVNSRVLDWVLEFKVAQLDELGRRFGARVDGIFLTDDWGTQRSTLVSRSVFEEFFAPRYAVLFGAIHRNGWHAILHSCGRINAFASRLVELGVDAFNLQQPRACGIAELGEELRGKACFLATADIQLTLPGGVEEAVREEVRLLLRHWATPAGGFIAFDYGDPGAIGARPEMTRVLFDELVRCMRWPAAAAAPAAGTLPPAPARDIGHGLPGLPGGSSNLR